MYKIDYDCNGWWTRYAETTQGTWAKEIAEMLLAQGKTVRISRVSETMEFGDILFPNAPQTNCPKQAEINRLRSVLHGISDSRPDAHMDAERDPELVEWICETCRKASIGAYPPNAKEEQSQPGTRSATLKTQ